MKVSPGFVDYLNDLFAALGPVRVRPMFGGVGVYAGELMFGFLDRDETIYLRVDDQTREAFEAVGSGPFRYPFEDRRADGDRLLAHARGCAGGPRACRRLGQAGAGRGAAEEGGEDKQDATVITRFERVIQTGPRLGSPGQAGRRRPSYLRRL